MKIKINNQTYLLKRFVENLANKTYELFFDCPKDIDFSKGFIVLNDNDEICEEHSNYIYKWNILTDFNGIVLTNVEDNIETEDNKLFVPTQEQLDLWKKEQDLQTKLDNMVLPSEKDRLSDIEAAICELYELLGE